MGLPFMRFSRSLEGWTPVAWLAGRVTGRIGAARRRDSPVRLQCSEV